MRRLKTTACALLSTLALCSCASVPPVQPVAVQCPAPPAPPAWTMEPPSNSPQALDQLISRSGTASPATKQN